MNTVDINGDMETLAAIINNDIEGDFTDDNLTNIRQNLFRDCTKLTSAHLPNVATISSYAFANTGFEEITGDMFPSVTEFSSTATNSGGQFASCSKLRRATFPGITTISDSNGIRAFENCNALEYVCFPNLVVWGGGSSDGTLIGTCPSLTQILPEMFPVLDRISGGYAFRYVNNLSRLILLNLTSFTGGNSIIDSYSQLRVFRTPKATIRAGIFYTSTSPGRSWHQLRLLDIKSIENGITAGFLYSPNSLRTLILRDNAVIPLGSATGRFVTQSPLKSGGDGVDIYVPSALIIEYENATNWTTLVNDYGTARFHALEGSIYEDPDYDYDIGMED